MLFELLSSAIGGDAIRQMSQGLGEDETKTSNAVSTALPLLLGAISRNTTNPSGASALENALAKDHDGGVLDDIAGALSSGSSGAGEGILRHVLGEKRPLVEAGISKSTGLNVASVGKLLTMLAPLVMGALGRVRQQQGLDAGGLSNILKQETSSVGAQGTGVEGLLSLLDRDADGSVVDDIGGMLGNLLGGR
jgi:hypothetical protein